MYADSYHNDFIKDFMSKQMHNFRCNFLLLGNWIWLIEYGAIFFYAIFTFIFFSFRIITSKNSQFDFFLKRNIYIIKQIKLYVCFWQLKSNYSLLCSFIRYFKQISTDSNSAWLFTGGKRSARRRPPKTASTSNVGARTRIPQKYATACENAIRWDS